LLQHTGEKWFGSEGKEMCFPQFHLLLKFGFFKPLYFFAYLLSVAIIFFPDLAENVRLLLQRGNETCGFADAASFQAVASSLPRKFILRPQHLIQNDIMQNLALKDAPHYIYNKYLVSQLEPFSWKKRTRWATGRTGGAAPENSFQMECTRTENTLHPPLQISTASLLSMENTLLRTTVTAKQEITLRRRITFANKSADF